MTVRFGEQDAIALLERLLRPERSRSVEVGIGDDAAVIRIGAGRLVWTIDTCVDGVHFDRRWLDFADVGWRSFQAAASDLAAMGAEPVAALSSLILPRGISPRELARLGQGQGQAARDLGCPVAGGNVSRGGELSVTTALLGRARRPLLRSGARPGDEIWLIGDVGLAAAGLCALRRGLAPRGAALRACVSAWRRPRALLARGRALVGRARALIDVSDGLGGDVDHVAAASRVQAVIEETALRAVLAPELEQACRRLALDPLGLALRGGEDYALVATGPAARRPRWARRIGRIERGRGAVLERGDRTRVPLAAGFDHLA